MGNVLMRRETWKWSADESGVKYIDICLCCRRVIVCLSMSLHVWGQCFTLNLIRLFISTVSGCSQPIDCGKLITQEYLILKYGNHTDVKILLMQYCFKAAVLIDLLYFPQCFTQSTLLKDHVLANCQLTADKSLKFCCMVSYFPLYIIHLSFSVIFSVF